MNLARTQQIAAVNDAGNAMLERWRELRADYDRVRPNFFNLYDRVNAATVPAEVKEEFANIWRRAAAFNIALEKTEYMIASGTATWSNLKAEIEKFTGGESLLGPVRGALTDWMEDTFGLGAVQVVVPVTGLAFLALAVWYGKSVVDAMQNFVAKFTGIGTVSKDWVPLAVAFGLAVAAGYLVFRRK